VTLSELDTPALLIDLDIMERNLGRVADYARAHNLRLRPHTKTHKIPALARRQRSLGAAGITVAKVGEAEVMLAAEPDDLLVAYPVLGPRKLARLMAVAGRTQVTVALDSLIAAQQLSAAAHGAGLTIGVLVEFDAGLDRMGVRPGEELVALAREVAQLPGLTLAGLSFYPGHIKHLDEDGLRRLDALAALLAAVEADFARAGIPIRIVSGGSTPTLFQSHRLPLLNEIRPGTYIFNDRNTVAAGACTPADCAVSILVTVVSNARGASVMIDGGSKTFSSDRSAVAGDVTCGHIVEAPDARFVKMNEEHGFVDVRDSSRHFAVGDRVRVIPNHVCVAMNLHEQVYGMRGGEVEQVWRVEARGKLQ
jgi:D-serine deaminase-like pyridoxal phosphate-dependent protein